jgi:hypothetical protein
MLYNKLRVLKAKQEIELKKEIDALNEKKVKAKEIEAEIKELSNPSIKIEDGTLLEKNAMSNLSEPSILNDALPLADESLKNQNISHDDVNEIKTKSLSESPSLQIINDSQIPTKTGEFDSSEHESRLNTTNIGNSASSKRSLKKIGLMV